MDINFTIIINTVPELSNTTLNGVWVAKSKFIDIKLQNMQRLYTCAL